MYKKENLNIIKYKYDYGVYTLVELIELVKNDKMTKEEFRWITSYNYDGIIKGRSAEGS